MPRAESIQRSVVESRRIPILIISLTLLVLAVATGWTIRQLRSGIRAQIIGRDAAVMHAVTTTQLDEQQFFELGEVDAIGQLTAVLVASRLKGVLGTRLYDSDGSFVESFPPLVREAELPASDLEILRRGEPVSQFLPRVSIDEVFYWIESDRTEDGVIPLFVVEVPMRTSADATLLGFAQFLMEGHTIMAELERLDRRLAFQSLAVFGVASAILVGSLGWAFRRLRRAHALVADRTRHLERANEELGRAARTTAVGAITAHLIHGLRSPLTGLQHFVASLGAGNGESKSAEWETAVLTTRRMQALISEVVEVLREEESSSAYELTVGELLELVRARVDPLATSHGVAIEVIGGPDLRLLNRTANLIKLILCNLLENGIHATPAGKRVRLAAVGDATTLQFEVHDEGIGFPESPPGNVFAPRRSSREGGAGIGLAISKQLADYLGAALELTSTSARGCVFVLRLQPAAREDEHPPFGSPGGQTGLGRTAAMLLILSLSWACLGTNAEAALGWRWCNPTPHGNNIVDMSYWAAGTLAVQVTERGGIYTSGDLTHWMRRESGTRKALRAVAFLDQRMVITGEEGTTLYADPDLVIRQGTLMDGPTADWLEGCAASADRVVAVGDHGAVYTSDDGENWERQAGETAAWLRGVAYGAGSFVAVGESGTILTSTNGTSWAQVDSGTTADLNRVAYTGGRFVVVGENGVVRVSMTGSSWQGLSPGTTRPLLGVGSNGTALVVVGDEDVRRFEDNTWFDEMGATEGAPPWLYFTGLADTEDYLIAGQTGLMVRGERLSAEDWSWQIQWPSVRSWLFDMVWVPNLYVTVGDRGTVMTSTEGVEWDLELTPEPLTNTVFLGVGGTTNLLVAVGNHGGLMISPNMATNLVWTNAMGQVITQEVSTLGIAWQAIEPRPVTNDLQGVTHHAGRYYVSGDAGLILSSADGTNWVEHPTPVDRLLSGITGFPGGMVATGNDGAMASPRMGRIGKGCRC
jgi:signal transduction histidine kinase